MLYHRPKSTDNPLRAAIRAAYRMDENTCINQLIPHAQFSNTSKRKIAAMAGSLVTNVREYQRSHSGLDALLYEYDLSNEEGLALMCLAEALLRIPDKKTIDLLIHDKLSSADWHAHVGKSYSKLVNTATWGLMLSEKLLKKSNSDDSSHFLINVINKIIGRSSEPFIRKAVSQAMTILSHQFILGRTIEEALKAARKKEKVGYRHSYDMLGEGAKTAADAKRYFQSYLNAIHAIGKNHLTEKLAARPSISIKLSALHPRYEFAQYERVMTELAPKVMELCAICANYDISLTIDAEESERLDISLDIIELILTEHNLKDWEGFGIALQAYQKRAWHVIDMLAELSRHRGTRMSIRLVKGAYWDTEIKQTQMHGYENYPVFTRQDSTNISYIACAKKILALNDCFYPRFATHNAQTVATIIELTKHTKIDFEFQCLHGMGTALYSQVVGEGKLNIPCRVYAPVGHYQDLLPYLVRRLLENGANSSFVNRIANDNIPLDTLVSDPVDQVKMLDNKMHEKIPLPSAIFAQRDNAPGIDLNDINALDEVKKKLAHSAGNQWQVAANVNGKEHVQAGEAVFSPIDKQRQVGLVENSTHEQIEHALQTAHDAKHSWDVTPVKERADMLERAAKLFEKHYMDFIYLAIQEAGKTLSDAISEVREAIDFCYYYAAIAKEKLAEPQILHGYTGEYNHLQYHGRGVCLAISPWNFPFAIFTGQVVAALVAGNTVIAKPAEQTPLIAGLTVRLLHAAGIPNEVLHLLPGEGQRVGALLVNDPRINIVLFTGSTETAHFIQQSLANQQGPLRPLIAETGGQNAMIVDSSALAEQVVTDLMTSAFGSAGQRCSACRVLFVQNEAADNILEMLTGAMDELHIGDPMQIKTDIGPVIDETSLKRLTEHAKKMEKDAKLLHACALTPECERGTFFAPRAFEISDLKILEREVFGPILHVIRYDRKQLDDVISAINNTGYGLTLGIHSRINSTIDYIQQRIHAGNCYVNRNMIGAVVGLQPFGGEGLSGTGPKAGGPDYLIRLCVERTLCVDTTAAGGNASLMSLG